MKENFYEVDVTNYSEEHLKHMATIIVLNKDINGWNKTIDNLEMVLYEGHIVIRGWATKKHWDKFYKRVIEDTKLDYIYR